MCEQTGVQGGLGGGWFRLESGKGWLQRSPPERHTLFCLEFKQCNPSFRTSLSKVTGGVDICMDFWLSYSTAIRCRCGQCLRLQTKVQLFPSRVYHSSYKMPFLTSFGALCTDSGLCCTEALIFVLALGSGHLFLLHARASSFTTERGTRRPLPCMCLGFAEDHYAFS